ncbi:MULTISPECIES: response regulator transcription factor [unclassified Kitasatospora]|uniref:response regulator transcription factor n=1 Tax=unclassified Kitasatospora TaxID=2633591 RepID=UPI00070F7AE0|nr:MULTISPECIES: response regulator transcription factor [unclassified Kitasatospora]KQV05784.1 two-component system response regulator [Kitasatospora sp. Root107]KRB62588.1 two-component system response regulator [Kitasatospora sp. Root187]
MIRVLLVEDTGLMRGALTALLAREADIEVVAEAGGNGSLIARALSIRPDVAVIDVDCRRGEQLFLGGQLSAQLPECRLFLVTGSQPPDGLRRVLAQGVPGLIGKNAPAEQLVEGIRKVVEGHRYIDPELALLAIESLENPLTSRELEILRIAAEGTPTGEIALRLSLSVGTVRNHLSAVVGKVGARNRVDAIRIVRESGWL